MQPSSRQHVDLGRAPLQRESAVTEYSPPPSQPSSRPQSPTTVLSVGPISACLSQTDHLSMTNHSRQLNSSRNTSMTSMPRSGTPVSHLRLPSMLRSEFGDTTASYTDCNTPLSRVHSAVNAHAYLVTAPGTQDSPSSGLTHIPSPMFDSLASLNSEEEEEQMRVAAAAVAAERDGGPPFAPTPSTDSQSDNASRRTNAQGVPSAGEPAPGMLMSVQASQLRSSLPVAGREVAAAKQDDATDLVGAGAQASLPLHVKVDLARSKRRPTAIAKLGEWTPYEAAPAESYLLKPPLQFFRLRWALMRFNPLTWHCPGQGYTVGEALMTLAIIGQAVVTGFWWAIDPDFRVNVSVTGTMAVFILMLTFFMAIHSNVVALLLLGLPFDRQLPWHKLLALSTCFHSVIHLIAFYAGGRSDTMPDAEEPYHFSAMWRRNAYGMEVSGWLLAVPIFAMTFMGWAYISRRCFAAFYKVHILSAAATIVGVMLHGFGAAITSGIMPLALPGGAFWLLDLVLRATFGSALTRSSATKLRLIPATVKDGKPVVSIEVPHARGRSFTAGQWVFVCVPALGVLHWHPFTIASSSNDPDMRVAIACGGNWTGKLADLAARQSTAKVYVEGPYGSPMIDVHGPRYKCFVVIAGGIGWTFLRSWRRQLLQDACRGRPLKSVTTITVLRGADQHHAAEILDSPAIDGPLVLPSTLELQDNVFLTGVPKRPVVGEDGVARDFEPVSLPGVNTTCGRPDFFTLLSDAADIAKALGETRAAVLICGSLGIVRSIQDDIPKIVTDVAIDLHYEVLAF